MKNLGAKLLGYIWRNLMKNEGFRQICFFISGEIYIQVQRFRPKYFRISGGIYVSM